MADTHTTPFPPQDRLHVARTFPGLTPTERCLLFIISDYSNSTTGKAWPGTRRLAADIGLTRPSVSRIIKRLEAKGAILCVRRLGTHNIYAMNMEQKVPVTLASQSTSQSTSQSSKASFTTVDKGVKPALQGCVASGTPVDICCVASDTGGVSLATQGCVASDTGGVPLATHEQSINRERKEKRKESPDFSSFSSSSSDEDKDGDKGGEEVQDQSAAIAALFHDLAASMPQSKPGARRHSTAKASPVENVISPFRHHLSELMANGLPYLEAYEKAERECGLDSPSSLPSLPEVPTVAAAPTVAEQATAAVAVQESLPATLPTLSTAEEFTVPYTPAADGA